MLTGGEALSPSLTQAVRGGWPKAELVDLYGSTETGSCDCHRPRDVSEAGSIGMPTEGVSFRIVRDDGALAALGETGELRIRTACGMLGYLDGAELTRSALEADHFRTGDLARLRQDGHVELVGRSKEIIARGGNKIAPWRSRTPCARIRTSRRPCAPACPTRASARRSTRSSC